MKKIKKLLLVLAMVCAVCAMSFSVSAEVTSKDVTDLVVAATNGNLTEDQVMKMSANLLAGYMTYDECVELVNDATNGLVSSSDVDKRINDATAGLMSVAEYERREAAKEVEAAKKMIADGEKIVIETWDKDEVTDKLEENETYSDGGAEVKKVKRSVVHVIDGKTLWYMDTDEEPTYMTENASYTVSNKSVVKTVRGKEEEFDWPVTIENYAISNNTIVLIDVAKAVYYFNIEKVNDDSTVWEFIPLGLYKAQSLTVKDEYVEVKDMDGNVIPVPTV